MREKFKSCGKTSGEKRQVRERRKIPVLAKLVELLGMNRRSVVGTSQQDLAVEKFLEVITRHWKEKQTIVETPVFLDLQESPHKTVEYYVEFKTITIPATSRKIYIC